jgi:hypothetical protein
MKVNDLVTAALVLDCCVSIDAGYGCIWASSYALHDPCARGNFDVVALLLVQGANPESQEHDRTALGFALHPWACVHDLGSGELLLRQDAKAEADVHLNCTWMCGGPQSRTREPAASRNGPMGLRHPCSEYSPEAAARGGRRKPMAILLAHGRGRRLRWRLLESI